MTAVKTAPRGRLDLSEFTAPEHQEWKAHHRLIEAVGDRLVTGWRGCVGLAAVVRRASCVDYGSRVFLPNADVGWASVVDVPAGHFSDGPTGRAVQWGTVRKAVVRYGLPSLPADDANTQAFDLCLFPADKTKVVFPDGGVATMPRGSRTLSPTHHPQLFRAFNAVNWAMTTAAFAYRRAWEAAKPACHKALGQTYVPDLNLLKFGDSLFRDTAPAADWMPRPYLAFPADLHDSVFDLMNGRVCPLTERTYSPDLVAAFVDAAGRHLAYEAPFRGLVVSVRQGHAHGVPCATMTLRAADGPLLAVRFHATKFRAHKAAGAAFEAGEVLGTNEPNAALAKNWFSMPPETRWQRCQAGYGPRLDGVVRFWFERQAVWLTPGLVHYPSQIAGLAATSSSLDDSLVWDVSPAADYHRDDCDALVLPGLPIGRWWELTGCLPGGVAYDFTPHDERVAELADRQRRAARNPHAYNGGRGVTPHRPRGGAQDGLRRGSNSR